MSDPSHEINLGKCWYCEEAITEDCSTQELPMPFAGLQVLHDRCVEICSDVINK